MSREHVRTCSCSTAEDSRFESGPALHLRKQDVLFSSGSLPAGNGGQVRERAIKKIWDPQRIAGQHPADPTRKKGAAVYKLHIFFLQLPWEALPEKCAPAVIPKVHTDLTPWYTTGFT